MFLDGDLEEEIYMEVPPRFGSNLATKKVCKMKKAPYMLKQSPKDTVWKVCQSDEEHGV